MSFKSRFIDVERNNYNNYHQNGPGTPINIDPPVANMKSSYEQNTKSWSVRIWNQLLQMPVDGDIRSNTMIDQWEELIGLGLVQDVGRVVGYSSTTYVHVYKLTTFGKNELIRRRNALR